MHVIQNVDDACSFWITCVAAEDAKQMDAGDGASGDARRWMPVLRRTFIPPQH